MKDHVLAELRALLVALALGGCGAAMEPASAVPLETPRVGVEAIHLTHGVPTVRARVEHVPMQLVLDTGTNAHVLVGAALALAGGTFGESITGEDASAEVVGAIAVGVRLRVARHAAAPVLVVSRSMVTEARVAGVLTPLAWAEDGVRIDLTRGELTIGARDDREGSPSFTGRVGRCVGPSPALVAMVEAEVAGVPAQLLVDTGSTRTTIFAESDAGRRILASSPSSPEVVYAAVGELVTQQVSDIAVHVGSHARDVAVHVHRGRTGGCEADGLLGMDMLLGCVLDIHGPRLAVRCGGEPPSIPPLLPEETRVHVARVEIEPTCGVDADALAAAAHPAGGWSFADWLEAAEALSSHDADADPIAASALMIAAACRDAGTRAPVHQRRWTREAVGLVLRYERRPASR